MMDANLVLQIEAFRRRAWLHGVTIQYPRHARPPRPRRASGRTAASRAWRPRSSRGLAQAAHELRAFSVLWRLRGSSGVRCSGVKSWRKIQELAQQAQAFLNIPPLFNSGDDVTFLAWNGAWSLHTLCQRELRLCGGRYDPFDFNLTKEQHLGV